LLLPSSCIISASVFHALPMSLASQKPLIKALKVAAFGVMPSDLILANASMDSFTAPQRENALMREV
jgi:hypothetical protein